MQENRNEPRAVDPSATEQSELRSGQETPALVARLVANPRRVRRA